jgi:Ca-activated chloride channel family protein
VIAWRDPAFLFWLVLVPAAAALLAFALRRRRTALQRFAEARLLPTLVPDLDGRRTRWRAALLVAALTCLVLALAGPQFGFHWEEVRREGVDIIVAIDTSRSMLADDVKPNRLARAKLAVEDLLKQLRGDRIGLVAFAGTAFTQCPLTLDYQAFAESLRAVNVGIIPKGGTALAEAIDTSLNAFETHQSKYEALILITDGEDHEGKVVEAAQRAADRGLKVYTVGIGTTEGELIPASTDQQQGFFKDRRGNVVKSRLDDDTLKKIAATTNGAYVHAAGPNLGLDEIYRDYIAPMDKRELQSAMQRRFEERFQIPLLAAFVLLLVEPLVGGRRLAPATTRLRWRDRLLRRRHQSIV